MGASDETLLRLCVLLLQRSSTLLKYAKALAVKYCAIAYALFPVLLTALLSGTCSDVAQAKNLEIRYFSQVDLVRRTLTRLYMTELFSVPTDTLNWTIPKAPLQKRDYCVDRGDLDQYLDRSGTKFVLRSELFQGDDLSVWPLRCIPTKIVSAPDETKSGTLRIAALNLIDPHKLVDRVMEIIEGKKSLADYVMDEARYLQIYSRATRDLDMIKEMVRKRTVPPIGLELEQSEWFHSGPKPTSEYLPLIRHRRPVVITDDRVFTVIFEIEPFR
jgi:hypothetical protein